MTDRIWYVARNGFVMYICVRLHRKLNTPRYVILSWLSGANMVLHGG